MINLSLSLSSLAPDCGLDYEVVWALRVRLPAMSLSTKVSLEWANSINTSTWTADQWLQLEPVLVPALIQGQTSRSWLPKLGTWNSMDREPQWRRQQHSTQLTVYCTLAWNGKYCQTGPQYYMSIALKVPMWRAAKVRDLIGKSVGSKQSVQQSKISPSKCSPFFLLVHVCPFRLHWPFWLLLLSHPSCSWATLRQHCTVFPSNLQVTHLAQL